MAPHPLPVAILVSGRGSNMKAIIDARERGQLPVTFTLVGSNKAQAPALDIARNYGIETFALDTQSYATRRAYDLALFERIRASGARFVILAGFMRILDAEAIAPWHGRILNIHPSLLPKYPGLHTHRKALEAKDTRHGASVHFITAELDGGPVISQATIAIHTQDNEQTLAERLLPFEHQLFPATLKLIAENRIELTDQGILFDQQPLTQPLQLQQGEWVQS